MRHFVVMSLLFGAFAFAGGKDCSLPLEKAEAIAKDLAVAELRLEHMKFSQDSSAGSLQYKTHARDIERRRKEAAEMIGETELKKMIEDAKERLVKSDDNREIVTRKSRVEEENRLTIWDLETDVWQKRAEDRKMQGIRPRAPRFSRVYWSPNGEELLTLDYDVSESRDQIVKWTRTGVHVAHRGAKGRVEGVAIARNRDSQPYFAIKDRLGTAVFYSSSLDREEIDVDSQRWSAWHETEIMAQFDSRADEYQTLLRWRGDKQFVVIKDKNGAEVDSFLFDDRYWYTINDDKTKLFMCGVATQKCYVRDLVVHKQNFICSGKFVNSATFSPDNQRLAVVGDSRFEIYKMSSATAP